MAGKGNNPLSVIPFATMLNDTVPVFVVVIVIPDGSSTGNTTFLNWFPSVSVTALSTVAYNGTPSEALENTTMLVPAPWFEI